MIRPRNDNDRALLDGMAAHWGYSAFPLSDRDAMQLLQFQEMENRIGALHDAACRQEEDDWIRAGVWFLELTANGMGAS